MNPKRTLRMQENPPRETYAQNGLGARTALSAVAQSCTLPYRLPAPRLRRAGRFLIGRALRRSSGFESVFSVVGRRCRAAQILTRTSVAKFWPGSSGAHRPCFAHRREIRASPQRCPTLLTRTRSNCRWPAECKSIANLRCEGVKCPAAGRADKAVRALMALSPMIEVIRVVGVCDHSKNQGSTESRPTSFVWHGCELNLEHPTSKQKHSSRWMFDVLCSPRQFAEERLHDEQSP